MPFRAAFRHILICCPANCHPATGVATRVSLRPGETPDQAKERRVRESQKVDERVVHVTDLEDWDKATSSAGSALVVVEVCSSSSSSSPSCPACYVSDSSQPQSSCTHTCRHTRSALLLLPCRCVSSTFTARSSLNFGARQASKRRPSCTGSRTSEPRWSPVRTSSTPLRASHESAQTSASSQST